MYRIVKKEKMNEAVNKFVIEAPLIARKRKPGQFIILRLHEKGERIPITIADSDIEKGTITIYVQKIGKTTYEFGSFKEGDYILDVSGPLGNPTPIEKKGNIYCIAGGVGAAEIYPIAKAYKEEGNNVYVIIGARNKELVIMEKEFKSFADDVYITTDDGSYGRKGFVSDELLEHINNRKIDEVIAVGPAIMMKVISELTLKYKIPTLCSLNAIMIDGTGMCGVCRVEVDGITKYACVDGPEFDAHKVNFDLLMKRLKSYLDEERISLEQYKHMIGERR